ncbi:unnamed protein product, partial [Effrenium voratum]
TAYQHFRAWKKRNRVSCSQTLHVTKGVLNEPNWTLKAYNGRVVAAWLASCAAEVVNRSADDSYMNLTAACLPEP